MLQKIIIDKSLEPTFKCLHLRHALSLKFKLYLESDKLLSIIFCDVNLAAALDKFGLERLPKMSLVDYEGSSDIR
jgi:hypothetical protein